MKYVHVRDHLERDYCEKGPNMEPEFILGVGTVYSGFSSVFGF